MPHQTFLDVINLSYYYRGPGLKPNEGILTINFLCKVVGFKFKDRTNDRSL